VLLTPNIYNFPCASKRKTENEEFRDFGDWERIYGIGIFIFLIPEIPLYPANP
jgi:hypothetical protein